MFVDPFTRDDPKPMTNAQYLAIATVRAERVRSENGEYMDDVDVGLMREFAEEVENAVRRPGDIGQGLATE
ncbi:hypothetical protein CALCODRAFT_483821 [Calocera cornea HHB12733]|uniref:Uncharacterized protein n=1 Tax=Calocera cornea HHB12733 TaxID=1353952 RepID=A0A165FCR9_9BASI|nr:hypothetical protein CALCODRAFT_483821 [Calocera cornea HHB12733]